MEEIYPSTTKQIARLASSLFYHCLSLHGCISQRSTQHRPRCSHRDSCTLVYTTLQPLSSLRLSGAHAAGVNRNQTLPHLPVTHGEVVCPGGREGRLSVSDERKGKLRWPKKGCATPLVSKRTNIKLKWINSLMVVRKDAEINTYVYIFLKREPRVHICAQKLVSRKRLSPLFGAFFSRQHLEAGVEKSSPQLLITRARQRLHPTSPLCLLSSPALTLVKKFLSQKQKRFYFLILVQI